MTNNKLTEEQVKMELAERCAQTLYQQDVASRHLGIELLFSAPGQSKVRMIVQDFMLQGYKTCHGGYMFTLADSAFAFACNTYNQPTVALGCSIDFVAPAFQGDVLVASCREQSRGGRTGNYDVEIYNQQDQLIAIFHGKSYRVKGEILSQENAND
ncbi:hydroxyphenylacetyl-CoA thioesterase PaaI [Marinomonas rhizomae]|uniref:Acyl-CoA thioesterase n=1 Tax=Marinomonas rhizomae TaxID=491948 RepID=A0A366JB77_9GAMM|nr:hydroxyphenylacetyl-CoA thioesterase PaaI [Marinomonas rhizomae]RBP83485.1 acyl-CoA thioesterase [Marinomonas rhizomae]RNF74036.1 hydroxyphenylacetyl-CoA thioesterase PaaI [Marinomonas rhizomae]